MRRMAAANFSSFALISRPRMDATLPDGPRGQLVAIAVTLTLLATVWLGIAAPLITWYQAGAEELAQRQTLLRHIQALVDTLPTLEHSPAATIPTEGALLPGTTDALAAAAMQSAVQAMAARSGVELASMETLPAEARGAYRRIGLRVSLTAPWPALIDLLRTAGQGQPGMLVDDVQLRTTLTQGAVAAIGATFTLLAFRAAPGSGS